MEADLTQLADLVEGAPESGRGRAAPVPEAALRAAEERVGPLPRSYRWWLGRFGRGTVGGADIATVPPPHEDAAAEDLTAGWRREGARLCFCVEPGCGDGYSFALDRPGAGGEFRVVRRDALDGDESPVAESFAGFLAVRTALALGLRDGPNPAVARLWRSTPGALLANGVLAYGPHLIGERNETFEVGRYAADWVLVGDDGGGGGLFMRRHGRDRESVYRLGLGALGEDVASEGELLTDDLVGWLEAGAPGAG
ncbi:SMI1/KNR4 family protein [Nocardiopsis sp. NPDC101807]|uniref:SMI1/KNR4 family protein n=1 Tax=Nocardiopsis sp. NPDC101807 TaxID=3364339 RepID=UPI0038041DE5